MIARAKADGSDAVWTGTVPTGPCMWVGEKPGNATMPNWKPILLEAPNEFRPSAPPDCKSAVVKAETDAVRQFDRKFPNNYKAFYWQSPSGLFTSWYDYASRWMFEDKTDLEPLRAARAYALLATVHFDAFIASNDGKFAYWYLRPSQLDPQHNSAVRGAALSQLSVEPTPRSRLPGARFLRTYSPAARSSSAQSARRRRFPHLGRHPL